MAAAGFAAKVDRLPNPDNPLHVATIDFEAMEYVTDGHRQRANAILLRRTDRLPFAAPPDWHVFEESSATPLIPTPCASTSSPTIFARS